MKKLPTLNKYPVYEIPENSVTTEFECKNCNIITKMPSSPSSYLCACFVNRRCSKCNKEYNNKKLREAFKK